MAVAILKRSTVETAISDAKATADRAISEVRTIGNKALDRIGAVVALAGIALLVGIAALAVAVFK